MPKILTVISLVLNVLLLALLVYLCRPLDPVVAKIENSIGNRRVVTATTVRHELVKRHAEDVLGDLAGREIVTLAAEESGLQLDVEELETRWHLWSTEPGVKASLDLGETTEREMRNRLTTLVLLDQLSLNDLNPNEREDVLRRFYEMNRGDLEEVKVSHILLESKNEARDVAQRLEAGVDFGQLATRFSLDPLTRDQGGNLGWKRRDQLSDEISPLIFLIPEGRASKPITTRHGWHLFFVAEKRTEFEDVRDTARRKWCELRRPDTLAELKERFQVASPPKDELMELLRARFDPVGQDTDDRQELR